MDKYEYKLRAEEIKDLISKKEYAEAMAIADTIDWRRVKNIMMLTTVSDLYKINRKYDVSRDILLLAYERHPGGRTIVYSLCELCIKLGDVVNALRYYKEFIRVAPNDSGQYILLYKLLDAQEASIDERIHVLEELKSVDYREKWGYELAFLYHRSGMETKCVSECDELILTFGQGKYVIKAMELKMLHKPLSATQQEIYEQRNQKKLTRMSQPAAEEAAPKALERPENAPEQAVMSADTKVMPGKEIDIQVKTLDMDNKYNTMNIQAALADSMKELMATEALEEETLRKKAEAKPVQEPTIVLEPSQEMKEIVFSKEEPVLEAQPVQAEAVQQEVIEEPAPVQEEELVSEEVYVQEESVQSQGKATLSFDPNMDTAQLIQNMAEMAALNAAAATTPYDDMLSQENDGQISLVVPEQQTIEKQITGQMSIEDILSEWEKVKKQTDMRSQESLAQKVHDQTDRMFTEFELSANSGILAGLDDITSKHENLPVELKEPEPEPKSEAELLVEALTSEEAFSEEVPEVEEIAEEYPEVEEIEEVSEEVPAYEEAVDNLSETTEMVFEEELPEIPEAASNFNTSDMMNLSDKLIEETEKETNGDEGKTTQASRALTEDEKELFGALIQTDQMKEQIATAIDTMSLAAYTGNVIITGEAGSGTMALAKNLIKSIQMSDSNFSGKVAKITGEALDKKDIPETLSKLRNGAVIIEKANGLSEESLQTLSNYLENENEGIIVILEDTKMDMRKCLNKNQALKNNFNARIDINAMDNDALVAYAKDYAYEQEYSIDDLGVLALYTRISDLQTGDHGVTLAEVRDIVDEAIWSVKRKTLKHFFNTLSGKRYDDEDMIILGEKDFIC